jgi:hypothetical protein
MNDLDELLWTGDRSSSSINWIGIAEGGSDHELKFHNVISVVLSGDVLSYPFQDSNTMFFWRISNLGLKSVSSVWAREECKPVLDSFP